MTREGHDDERGHELRPVQTAVGEVRDAGRSWKRRHGERGLIRKAF